MQKIVTGGTKDRVTKEISLKKKKKKGSLRLIIFMSFTLPTV